MQNGRWVPLRFFSRKLSAPEKKYSAFDRESLSAYQAVKHFRHYIEAKPFTLYTDQKLLTYALASTAERSPRQARHLSFIAEFTSDFQYIRGKHNMVADALSRIHAATIDFIDFHQLAKDQSSSIEIKAYRIAITGLVLQDVPFKDTTLVCNVSLGKPRPVISRQWTHKVFATAHSLSH